MFGLHSHVTLLHITIPCIHWTLGDRYKDKDVWVDQVSWNFSVIYHWLFTYFLSFLYSGCFLSPSSLLPLLEHPNPALHILGVTVQIRFSLAVLTCLWLVQDLARLVYYLFTTCSCLIHDLFMTCSCRPANNSQPTGHLIHWSKFYF